MGQNGTIVGHSAGKDARSGVRRRPPRLRSLDPFIGCDRSGWCWPGPGMVAITGNRLLSPRSPPSQPAVHLQSIAADVQGWAGGRGGGRGGGGAGGRGGGGGGWGAGGRGGWGWGGVGAGGVGSGGVGSGGV